MMNVLEMKHIGKNFPVSMPTKRLISLWQKEKSMHCWGKTAQEKQH